MSYSESATQLINWVENAIDRRKGGCERSKINIAIQTLALLAGILRADHPMCPNEIKSYGVYVRAKILLKETDPDLYESFYQLVMGEKARAKHHHGFNRVEAIGFTNAFKGFTKTKQRKLKSIIRKLNQEKVSYSRNNRFVEGWCDTLGLPIDLIRLNDEDLNDLARYLKSMYLDGETTDTDLPQQALTA
jgi:hypothetical protein